MKIFQTGYSVILQKKFEALFFFSFLASMIIEAKVIPV
jgi:hypothetical protein